MDTITTIQSLLKCNGSAQSVTVALTPSEKSLIAAAPDLLDALKDVWAEIENERAVGSRSLTWAEPDNLLFKSIRDALSKAEGGQS